MLGVEPDARMADFARCSGVEVEVATFEAWEPAGGSSTPSWPGRPGTGWTRLPERPRRRRCCGRAAGSRRSTTCSRRRLSWRGLSPGPTGRWRQTRRSTSADQSAGSALDLYQPLFAKIADGIREAGGFSEPEQWQFDWERTYSRDEWLDQLPTLGSLTQLPSDKVAEVLAEVGAAIDAIGGSFTMPYTTVVVTATDHVKHGGPDRRPAPRAIDVVQVIARW